MNRHLIISLGVSSHDDGLCAIRVVENNETIHFNGRVNYGLPITNIMEEWDCYELHYTAGAREKFLGKALDPDLLT